MQTFIVVNGSGTQVPETQDGSRDHYGYKDGGFRLPRPRFGTVKRLLPRNAWYPRSMLLR